MLLFYSILFSAKSKKSSETKVVKECFSSPEQRGGGVHEQRVCCSQIRNLKRREDSFGFYSRAAQTPKNDGAALYREDIFTVSY